MTTILPKKKWRVPRHSKATAAGNKGGQSGNKHTKRHDQATGMPGTPRGVCVGAKGIDNCRCGKHNV